MAPVPIGPDHLPLPKALDVNLCAEGQWVAIPRERRWFLAKILSYDEGSDEVKAHYYNTHMKNGRQQLKPSWYHPGSEKETLGTKGPKGYLAYTEVLERKLLYPQAVRVTTRCSKKQQITHEVSARTVNSVWLSSATSDCRQHGALLAACTNPPAMALNRLELKKRAR